MSRLDKPTSEFLNVGDIADIPAHNFICSWSPEEKLWLPLTIRSDKLLCTDPTIEKQKDDITKNTSIVSCETLVKHLNLAEASKNVIVKREDSISYIHPSRKQNFNELLADVYLKVEEGKVEKYVHAETGLEIFSYIYREVSEVYIFYFVY